MTHAVATLSVVITGLDPVIHALLAISKSRRGWPGQARP
ncbi:MAG: hypothetical protein OJF48_004636 [Afipia sp.]|nr:MAG: hypothetical protein OJF48_004636 [Afipia sp.]